MAESSTANPNNNINNFKSNSSNSIRSFNSNSFVNRVRFIFARSPYTTVPKSALMYEPTERIIRLSTPKKREEAHIRTEFSRAIFDPRNSCVYNKAALSAACSDRVATLAQPKVVHQDYVFPRPVATKVPARAKTAIASARIEVLAQPKKV